MAVGVVLMLVSNVVPTSEKVEPVPTRLGKVVLPGLIVVAEEVVGAEESPAVAEEYFPKEEAPRVELVVGVPTEPVWAVDPGTPVQVEETEAADSELMLAVSALETEEADSDLMLAVQVLDKPPVAVEKAGPVPVEESRAVPPLLSVIVPDPNGTVG